MEINSIKQLAVKHDYYCSENNYYDSARRSDYYTFSEFYEEWFKTDVDMNLCFRWDIKKIEKSKDYCMEIFIIQQRKGIFYPIFINKVEDKDVPKIIEYLKEHQKKLNQIWLSL